MIQLIAEFLARKDPVGSHLRGVLIQGFKALSPAEKFEVFSLWYSTSPDAVEGTIRDMPGRAEFHNRLIADYARRQQTCKADQVAS